MNEKILMILTLEEISNIIKGLKTAQDYISKDELKEDEKLNKDIDGMLKKLLYVESEYSKKER